MISPTMPRVSRPRLLAVHRLVFRLSAVCLGVVLLTSCQPAGIPRDALRLSPQSLAMRQMQTRVYETGDEKMILTACMELLQDLGFILDESETNLGVLVASKERSAVDSGQVASSVLMAVLLGVDMPYDTEQRMRASVVTRPVGSGGKRIAVRVTFQRIVWNSRRMVSRREAITDAQLYQQFFDKLSKAIFLEAQQI